MPKNKGKFRSQQPEVEAPVEQLQHWSEKVYEKAKPHLVKVGAVVGGVTVILVGFGIWSGVVHSREAAATQAFGAVMDKTTLPVAESGPSVDMSDPSNPVVATPDPSAVKTFQARSEAALAEAADFESKYGAGSVGGQALLVEAALDYDVAKYDDAVAAYKKFLAGSSTPDLIALGHEGLGYALEAKALAQTDATARQAGLDEALKAFADIEHDEKGAYYGLAAYHQGRILALKGDKAKAVELYKKALDKNPLPSVSADINNRLALLDAAK